MGAEADRLRGALEAAHAAALRVHDSPVRSDQVFRDLERIAADVAKADLGEERSTRVSASLADALRVLRREDDGREAAKHIQAALRHFEPRERKPSPFLDDL